MFVIFISVQRGTKGGSKSKDSTITQAAKPPPPKKRTQEEDRVFGVDGVDRRPPRVDLLARVDAGRVRVPVCIFGVFCVVFCCCVVGRECKEVGSNIMRLGKTKGLKRNDGVFAASTIQAANTPA
jgi:hypothetical protein